MTRPSYPTRQTSPGFPPHSRQDTSSGGDIGKILEKIKRCKNLSEISIDEITKESGIAETFAKKFGDKLKPTQLRKFFDKIVTNQENLRNRGWKSIEADFCMIRPNLAYAKGRKLIPDEFFQLISLCVERIAHAGSPEEEIKENYARFVQLLQSIVAYHTYYKR